MNDTSSETDNDLFYLVSSITISSIAMLGNSIIFYILAKPELIENRNQTKYEKHKNVLEPLLTFNGSTEELRTSSSVEKGNYYLLLFLLIGLKGKKWILEKTPLISKLVKKKEMSLN